MQFTHTERYTTEKAGMSIQQNPKYPSKLQIIAWEDEWEKLPPMDVSLTDYITRNACEWKAQQIINDVFEGIDGCFEGFCLITGRAKGMTTNGGCECHRSPRMQLVLRRLLAIRSGETK